MCAVACARALLLLMPLKQVDPYVVRVDSSTGIVDVVPVYAGRATPEEAVTRYFLTHYLSVCERFNFSTAESDYEECGAFHSAQRNQAWYALWTATNPASPLNVHKDGSTVRVQVNSVSFFTRASGLSDLAQVRYLKAARQGPGAEETFTHWVATIQYAYAEAAKDPKTRRWNPLGFKILDFRAEPEVINEAAQMTMRGVCNEAASRCMASGGDVVPARRRTGRRRCRQKAASTLEFGSPPTMATKSTDCAASSAIKSIWNSSPERASSAWVRATSKACPSSVRKITCSSSQRRRESRPISRCSPTAGTIRSTIRAAAQRPSEDDVIYSLRFTYPADAGAARRRSGGETSRLAARECIEPRPHNIDYWYCGEPALRPIGASDDGVHTR